MGASDLNMKAWALSNFLELGRRLINSYDAGIVIVGGIEEEDRWKIIMEALGCNIASFLGYPVDETAAIIEQCDLFVGNDSGPTHLAASVGTPVVGLYGPTNYCRTRQYGPETRIVRNEFPCSPCWCPLDWERFERLAVKRKGCMPAKCLQTLKVDQVFFACSDVLNGEIADCGRTERGKGHAGMG